VTSRFRASHAFLFLVLAMAGAVRADDLDTLSRDVDRLQSLRDVKDLQRQYAHFAQFGLWSDMAGLFVSDATFIRGSETIKGARAIREYLNTRGGGRQGLPPGGLNTELIDEPLANLSADGNSAKVRWMSLVFQGDGKGGTRIEGGIYENEYRREGDRWRIAVSHYHPQYEGNYENGWFNAGRALLPLVPYHFTIEESGIPLPAAAGLAPRSKVALAELEKRIQRLNDEDAVRNLQHAYGYYIDRKMWDDVVDLFAADSAVELNGTGTFKGKAGVRQFVERMGPAGLKHGQLNDRPIFDTIVEVLPGGAEAIASGIEMGMLGEADKGTAQWEFTAFRNRFVKEGGLWKLKELRLYPLLTADYATGWGRGGLASKQHDYRKLAAKPLTGAIPKVAVAAPLGNEADRLAAARRNLARSMAWDGTENISSAYGYYIDDFQWTELGLVFAEKGNKQSPFAGYYMGRERIAAAATNRYGKPAVNPQRAGIAMHWRIQPVILVSADGRSANLRTRLLQPGTARGTGKPDEVSTSAFMTGMYPNDQAVLENGIWRLWSLEIDEPYATSAGWKGGWSGVKPAPPGAPRPPDSPLVKSFPPDILMTRLGRRAEAFRGGTGETIEWPGILPMWFNYRNPVSGREPEKYWPDCVPCELMPDSSMTKHGWQMPPTGPQQGSP
jgi:hypothetical protein